MAKKLPNATDKGPDQPSEETTAAEATEGQTQVATEETTQDVAAVATAEPVEEPKSEEITLLEGAVAQVQQAKNRHLEEIETLQTKISAHRQEISNLDESLRKNFGSLLGSNGHVAAKKALKVAPKKIVAVAKKGPGRGRQASSSGDSTRELIMACLKENKAQKHPLVAGKDIESYIRKHGGTNNNPSVELSRLVGKEEILRPSRGVYSLP